MSERLYAWTRPWPDPVELWGVGLREGGWNILPENCVQNPSVGQAGGSVALKLVNDTDQRIMIVEEPNGYLPMFLEPSNESKLRESLVITGPPMQEIIYYFKYLFANDETVAYTVKFKWGEDVVLKISDLERISPCWQAACNRYLFAFILKQEG